MYSRIEDTARPMSHRYISQLLEQQLGLLRPPLQRVGLPEDDAPVDAAGAESGHSPIACTRKGVKIKLGGEFDSSVSCDELKCVDHKRAHALMVAGRVAKPT